MRQKRLRQPNKVERGDVGDVDDRRLTQLDSVGEAFPGDVLGSDREHGPADVDPHGPQIGVRTTQRNADTSATHADIEDGRIPDVTRGAMQGVAGNIAYRAVRNRGTIGGSLCHADPAADWVTVLIALDASVLLQGPDGARRLHAADFNQGAFRTALQAGELLRDIRIPRLSGDARWAYEKACRKPGDFAHAMAAVLLRGDTRRVVIGALGGRPLLLQGDAASMDGAADALRALDPVQRHMQLVVLRRAFARAAA